jgi:hypothetical protein
MSCPKTLLIVVLSSRLVHDLASRRSINSHLHYGFSIFDFFSPHEPSFFSMVDEKTRKWQNG